MNKLYHWIIIYPWTSRAISIYAISWLLLLLILYKLFNRIRQVENIIKDYIFNKQFFRTNYDNVLKKISSKEDKRHKKIIKQQIKDILNKKITEIN